MYFMHIQEYLKNIPSYFPLPGSKLSVKKKEQKKAGFDASPIN